MTSTTAPILRENNDREEMVYYVVSSVHMWDKLELETSNYGQWIPCKFEHGPDGSVGFMKVFDDEQKALAAANWDTSLICILKTKNVNKAEK